MEAPARDHLATMKHLLRYITGTLTYGYAYHRSDDEALVGYSDSDHASDVNSRKSTLVCCSSSATVAPRLNESELPCIRAQGSVSSGIQCKLASSTTTLYYNT